MIDNRPEHQVNPAETTVNFLKKSGAMDLMADKDKFNDWLEKQDSSSILDKLVRLNGLVRGVPIHQRRFDGDTVSIEMGLFGTAFSPVDQDKKLALLEEAFSAIKETGEQQDKALLAYLAIETIHPFADGNGRTGRLIYHLLSNVGQPTSSEDISKLISHYNNSEVGEEAREIINQTVRPVEEILAVVSNFYLGSKLLPPAITIEYRQLYTGLQLGAIPDDLAINVTDPKIKGELEQCLSEAAEGQSFPAKHIAILKYLLAHNQLERFKFPLPRKGVLGVDGDKILGSLNNESAQEIIGYYKEAKILEVRGLIDIISHPENNQTPNGKPVKDLFYAPK